MLCKHYKNALIEAASSGAAPHDELRSHLAECASCRSAFAEEQSLFATIDSSLQASTNFEVPSSLLPRVRIALNEATSPRFRWLQPLVFVSATVALVFAAFLMARPRHSAPEEVTKQSAVAVPAATARPTETNPEKVSSMGAQIAAVHAAHSHTVRNSTLLHSAASSNPEVLVPPDEREGLARLVATMNGHRDIAVALAQRREEKDALITVDPLQIPDIEIKPLEGTETETSDGASEKH